MSPLQFEVLKTEMQAREYFVRSDLDHLKKLRAKLEKLRMRPTDAIENSPARHYITDEISKLLQDIDIIHQLAQPLLEEDEND